MHSHTITDTFLLNDAALTAVPRAVVDGAGVLGVAKENHSQLLELTRTFLVVAGETYYRPLGIADLRYAVRLDGKRFMIAFVDNRDAFSVLDDPAMKLRDSLHHMFLQHPTCELHYRREDEHNVLALVCPLA